MMKHFREQYIAKSTFDNEILFEIVSFPFHFHFRFPIHCTSPNSPNSKMLPKCTPKK
jgi:hypothetical protein